MNKNINKLIKTVIAGVLSWWVGVGVRLVAFAFPISHFWQTAIAAVVALSLLAFCSIRIFKK